MRRLWRAKLQILISLLLIFVMGELYFRIPWIPQRLEYTSDQLLGARFKPNQYGFMGMEMQFLKNSIRINADGLRGAETNWHLPSIIVVGDSQAFGSGVRDEEIWSELVESRLNKRLGHKEIQVVNASHPGHGPWHHYVVVRNLFSSKGPRPLIVWVSVEDRNFKSLSEKQVLMEIKGVEFRAKIRRWTKFLPFLYNKMEAQLPSIKRVFRLPFSPEKQTADSSSALVAEEMYQENERWWRGIIELCKRADVPVWLCIPNPMDRESDRILYERLTRLSRDYPKAKVFQIGSAAFGLSGLNPVEQKKVFKKRFTLVYDPHGNALYHKTIADAIYMNLVDSNWLE